jgi:hypothetical protein
LGLIKVRRFPSTHDVWRVQEERMRDLMRDVRSLSSDRMGVVVDHNPVGTNNGDHGGERTLLWAGQQPNALEDLFIFAKTPYRDC